MTEFTCDNGKCISQDKRCDGSIDCEQDNDSDNSDEFDCGNNLSYFWFKTTLYKCWISNHFLNDNFSPIDM